MPTLLGALPTVPENAKEYFFFHQDQKPFKRTTASQKQLCALVKNFKSV